ncbi:MAG: ABC transporter permease [Bacteroidetes bacterium GWF2_29_10]|nr:MAG: ABC transporter permease [Bacteroidetes bacterium GWF2_29_10]
MSIVFALIHTLGHYAIFMRNVVRKPDKWKVFWQQFFRETDVLGIDSIGITAFISIFVGAVIAIQTYANITSPLTPNYLIGFATRESMILEFAPTMLSLILAGKIGSRIASEIGTMRVTEQIDALEIMGINTAGYLVYPKLIASLFIFPFLVLLSMIMGVWGGYLVAFFTGIYTIENYIIGIQYSFIPFNIIYALIKTLVFAFIIITVSSYQGYYVKGGSIDVGKASTKAVVYSCIIIIFFNLLLTQVILG